MVFFFLLKDFSPFLNAIFHFLFEYDNGKAGKMSKSDVLLKVRLSGVRFQSINILTQSWHFRVLIRENLAMVRDYTECKVNYDSSININFQRMSKSRCFLSVVRTVKRKISILLLFSLKNF